MAASMSEALLLCSASGLGVGLSFGDQKWEIGLLKPLLQISRTETARQPGPGWGLYWALRARKESHPA
jgi:hypothetical protein